jgi:hypothetical protein
MAQIVLHQLCINESFLAPTAQRVRLKREEIPGRMAGLGLARIKRR